MLSIQIGRWQFAFVIYGAIVATLVYFRPALMFDNEGNPKSFATENTPTTTPFAPILMFPLIGFILYFIVSAIELART